MLIRLGYSKPVYIKIIMNYFVVGGSRGVFDIDDLVTVLRSENAKDICVIALPDHLRLADYMVIVSGISFRHCRAITSTIQWIVSSLLRYSSPSSCKTTPVKGQRSKIVNYYYIVPLQQRPLPPKVIHLIRPHFSGMR